MKEVYPPRILNTFKKMAQELAALNGQLDMRTIKSFSSKAMKDALTTAIQRAQELNDSVRTNVMRALASPDPRVVDVAADQLLAGGRELHLEAVRGFLGVDSPEWAAIRRYALKKVLREAVVETPTLSKSIEGKAIDDAMLRWTEREQDLLFPMD